MKKFLKGFVCLALSAVCAAGFAACAETPADPTPQDPSGDTFDGTHYNIVFTLATIPPVLAALDSVGNGYETYAMIERGNTYSGIATTEGLNFHNVGFDVTSNKSEGFQEEQFTAMVDCIEELNKGEEVFHIYLRDADPMFGFALAANAGLKKGQYELILCEDGVSTYTNFRTTYVDGKSVSAQHDEPYEA